MQWKLRTVFPVEIHLNPVSGNALYFIIILCLMPDNRTHPWKSAATQGCPEKGGGGGGICSGCQALGGGGG